MSTCKSFGFFLKTQATRQHTAPSPCEGARKPFKSALLGGSTTRFRMFLRGKGRKSDAWKRPGLGSSSTPYRAQDREVAFVRSPQNSALVCGSGRDFLRRPQRSDAKRPWATNDLGTLYVTSLRLLWVADKFDVRAGISIGMDTIQSIDVTSKIGADSVARNLVFCSKSTHSRSGGTTITRFSSSHLSSRLQRRPRVSQHQRGPRTLPRHTSLSRSEASWRHILHEGAQASTARWRDRVQLQAR